ncbi:MAG TPA: peroxiredoxin family protein [Streptosporangiales bacterium]
MPRPAPVTSAVRPAKGCVRSAASRSSVLPVVMSTALPFVTCPLSSRHATRGSYQNAGPESRQPKPGKNSTRATANPGEDRPHRTVDEERAVPLLHPGETFPDLTVSTVGGGAVHLPEALAGDFGVILFFRGAWCPYCNAQLRAFQRAGEKLAEAGARVVALSVDDEKTTADLVDEHRLTFPVGHSADAHRLARLTGAFVNEDPLYVQSTGFVLDPDGRVVVSVYSSGAIGRLVPDDVVGLVRYIRKSAAKA